MIVFVSEPRSIEKKSPWKCVGIVHVPSAVHKIVHTPAIHTTEHVPSAVHKIVHTPAVYTIVHILSAVHNIVHTTVRDSPTVVRQIMHFTPVVHTIVHVPSAVHKMYTLHQLYT